MRRALGRPPARRAPPRPHGWRKRRQAPRPRGRGARAAAAGEAVADAPAAGGGGEVEARAQRRRRRVCIVGSGPAGLMCAQRLAEASEGLDVHVFERRSAPCMRLLLAGRGGLNITHSEASAAFLRRYTGGGAGGERSGGAGAAAAAVEAFGGADAVREFCASLGVETFVGSSGRVFPTELRATPLLRAWMRKLNDLGVHVHYRRRLAGVSTCSEEGVQGSIGLRFEREGSDAARVDELGAAEEGLAWECDALVLALGGASWPGLGSDGAWTHQLADAGRPLLDCSALRPANVGFRAVGEAGADGWGDVFRERFAGAWCKDVRLRFGAESSAGDLVITENGIEGGPVYALGHLLVAALDEGQGAAAAAAGHGGVPAGDAVVLRVDFRPGLSVDALAAKLAPPAASARATEDGSAPKKKKKKRKTRSVSERLRRAGVSPVALAMLREAEAAYGYSPEGASEDERAAATIPLSELSHDSRALAAAVKGVPIRLAEAMPLSRAISTAGGVRVGRGRGQVDARTLCVWNSDGEPTGVFCAGEMLDWSAPTGGYLLTASFATGARAAAGVLDFLPVRP